MDHSEAVANKIAESYLLGELSPEQREAYEEHYFNCAECANDVVAGAALVANVKEVLRAEPRLAVSAESEPRSVGWFAWLRPAYAMAALVVVFGVLLYQNLVSIPRLKGELNQVTAPRALAYYSFVTQGSRGASEMIIQTDREQPLGLYVDIPPGGEFTSYTCTIQSESGVVELSVPVSAEQAKDPVQLLVHGSQLQAGKHVLVIRGIRSSNNPSQAGAEVADFRFTLEYKNEGTTKQ